MLCGVICKFYLLLLIKLWQCQNWKGWLDVDVKSGRISSEWQWLKCWMCAGLFSPLSWVKETSLSHHRAQTIPSVLNYGSWSLSHTFPALLKPPGNSSLSFPGSRSQEVNKHLIKKKQNLFNSNVSELLLHLPEECSHQSQQGNVR